MSAQVSPSLSATSGAQHFTNDNPANVFLQVAFEKLQNAKEIKKLPKLKESIVGATQKLKQANSLTGDSASGPRPIPLDVMKSLLQTLQLACNTRIINLVTISLDCVAKLMSYNVLHDTREKSSLEKDTIEDPPKANDEKSPTGASSTTKVDTRSLTEMTVDMVCECNMGEGTDEKVHLQIVKALLAAATASEEPIHGNALLKAIRTTWNIFLVSKVGQIQTVAQGCITQMVNTVFSRAVSAQKTNEKVTSPTSVKSHPASSIDSPDSLPNSLKDPTVESDLYQATQIPLPPSNLQSPDDTAPLSPTYASTMNLTQPTPSTVDSATNDKEPFLDSKLGSRTTSILFFQDPENPTYYEYCIRDVYLVFRALCKLSMKSVNEQTSSADIKSTSINSRVLSLQQVLLAVKSFPSLFKATCYIPGQKVPSTTILDAVRNTMCLSMAHALTSPNPLIYKVALEFFIAAIQNLRYSIKRESEIFMSEILLSILEMKTASPTQKVAILNSFSTLLQKPQILVEIYVNYDCSQDAMDNIFERLMNTLSKIITSSPMNTDLASASMQTELVVAALETLSVSVHSLSEWVTSNSRSTTLESNPLSNGQPAPLDDPNQLESDKQKKTLLAEAIHEFNIKPKKGIEFLQVHQMLSNNPEEIAQFLMNTEGLNKKMLGEYMGDG
ncbi:guanine nucleotide exchange protein for ADP-robosylation factor, partial [Coelomomyces lativittatus]